jgi:hypothetical protein
MVCFRIWRLADKRGCVASVGISVHASEGREDVGESCEAVSCAEIVTQAELGDGRGDHVPG